MKKYELVKYVDGEWYHEGTWSEANINGLVRAAMLLANQFEPEDVKVVIHEGDNE